MEYNSFLHSVPSFHSVDTSPIKYKTPVYSPNQDKLNKMNC